MGIAALALLALQEKAPGASQQKALIEAFFAASGTTRGGWDQRLGILKKLEPVALNASQVGAQAKALQKLWEKGRTLAKDSGQAFFWEKERRGLYIVGGETKKPRALVVCMHGGGAGSGEAASAFGAYDPAFQDLKWLALYPQVLEQTECGWTDAGSEEFVLELMEAARRTWKIDPDRVFLAGHSMGGYG